MFGCNLYGLTLNSEDAKMMFPNIIFSSFCSELDDTLPATIRMLMHNRLPSDEELRVNVTSIYNAHQYCGQENPSVALRKQFANNVNTRHIEPNSLNIALLNGRYHEIESLVETIRSEFALCDTEHKWVEQEDIRVFFSRHMPFLMYVDEETKSSFIIIGRGDTQSIHYAQTVLSRALPWYFKENPLTSSEKEVIASLTETAGDRKYYALLEQFSRQFDFTALKNKRLLNGVTSLYLVESLASEEGCLDTLDRDIQRNLTDYYNLCERRDCVLTTIAGLRARIDTHEGDQEVIDYFNHSSHLDLFDVHNRILYFRVKTYLDSFDADVYEACMANTNSFYHSLHGISKEVFQSHASRKKLLDAIFGSDGELRIRCCAIFKLNLAGRVESQSHYDFPADYDDYMPNPHLQYHNCLGGNSAAIRTALRDSDLIAAVEQCVACAKSVNISEDATVKTFFIDLLNTDKRCIETPDHQYLTPEEALEWLNKNNEEEE